MSSISQGFGIHGNEVNVFKRCTGASRATSHLSSGSVIWYTVLFRQNRTDRPNGHIPICSDFRDREAQVGQIRYVLIPRISKIAPGDLRSAFQQMTGERSFSQEFIIVHVPAKLKEQRTQNQRRISHPPSNHHVSPLLQSLGDPLGAQVGIGGNEKRLQRL